MKCVFVFNNAPLTQNYHGAAARYTQAFKALINLGIQVHVLRLLETKRQPGITGFERSQPSCQLAHYNQAASWRDIVYSSPSKKAPSRLSAIVKGLLNPLEFAFPEITALQRPLEDMLAAVQPDFLLVEMYPAAALVAATKPNLPWILGHHDWVYRYLQPKTQRRPYPRLRYKFISQMQRRAEILVARRSAAVISASCTEAEELRRLGARSVHVIPSTYDSVPGPSPERVPQKPLRIIHLGQLTTHSNALGLRDYLREVGPELPEEWELCIVGSTHNADPELLRELEQVNAKIMGRVENLSTVMRPFDVAIIPFQRNMGERTKIPLLFNYAQVVVAHEASVAGSLYLDSGNNCLVLPSLNAFPDVLKELANNDAMRQRIGLAAKATFERFYTLEAQIPTFRRVLEEAGV